MSFYILDTDILTLNRKGHHVVTQRVKAERPLHRLAITIITAEEQLSGWYTQLRQATRRDEKARRYQELTETILAMHEWEIISFPEPAIIRYEALLAMKLNVGKKDLCIAAITFGK